MVISGEQEKRRRRCWITELPDSIMESIVTLLPLKDAVNTIQASPSNWKTLSYSILTRRNLDLDFDNIFGSNSVPYNSWQQCRDFSRRVSKYLQQYEGNKIHSFRLQCHSPLRSHVSVDEWILLAATKGVEEIHLTLALSGYVFPPRLQVGSTFVTLKHLSLEKCNFGHDTADFGQLTTLSLKDVACDQSLMPNLFKVCVLLKSLTLRTCQIQGPLVAGDRLTHLKVMHCEEGTKMEIKALNLASLEYIPYYECSTFNIKAPQLTRIFFSTSNQILLPPHITLVPQALMQFGFCPGLETLHLHMPNGLPRISSIGLYGIRSIPITYGNLKQLNLDIDLDRYRKQDKEYVDVNFVLDLLKAAPYLEELVIVLIYGGVLIYDVSETNKKETRNYAGFTNDHLRMVKMQGFRGYWYETELAICILEISPKLEMLVIDQTQRFYLGDGKFSQLRGSYSEQPRGVMEEKLKKVKTDARIIFL